MKLLLDTQAFIWWDNDRARLTPQVINACEDETNSLYLSIASIWEMQIKIQLGKLNLPASLPTIIETQISQNGLILLSIQPSHIYEIGNLPEIHRDPFDRIMIAQARIETMQFVTSDNDIARYPLTTLW